LETSLAELYRYRLTIRIRSDDTIRPNMNTLFGTEANIRYIPTFNQSIYFLKHDIALLCWKCC